MAVSEDGFLPVYTVAHGARQGESLFSIGFYKVFLAELPVPDGEDAAAGTLPPDAVLREMLVCSQGLQWFQVNRVRIQGPCFLAGPEARNPWVSLDL